MNATKCVLLLVIGVCCAIVTARHVEEVSKETKLGTSLPKTTTKGVGAQLFAYGATYSTSDVYSFANAFKNPKGPGSNAYENGYTGTNGVVYAKGHKARVSSASRSKANGNAEAAVTHKAAAARAKERVAAGEEADIESKRRTAEYGGGRWVDRRLWNYVVAVIGIRDSWGYVRVRIH
ncbi:unnamed protein product [Arabidopsis halleri]